MSVVIQGPAYFYEMRKEILDFTSSPLEPLGIRQRSLNFRISEFPNFRLVHRVCDALSREPGRARHSQFLRTF